MINSIKKQGKPPQKNKILTLRTDEETRSKAHLAARNLYDQSLSEFLTNKIERLLSEYERELPKILKAQRQTQKQKEMEDPKNNSNKETVIKKAPRGRPKINQSHNKMLVIDIMN